MEAYATHQDVLKGVLKLVSKPVLELGAGNFSTQLIHDSLKDKGIHILTIESNSKWLAKYTYLESKEHSFKLVNLGQYENYYKHDKTEWGLVFIDCESWKDRITAIMKYKDIADYIILHDCDYYPDNNLFGKKIRGKREYDDVFKYWIEFFIKDWKSKDPPTLLGSNKYNLKDFVVSKDLIVFGKSSTT